MAGRTHDTDHESLSMTTKLLRPQVVWNNQQQRLLSTPSPRSLFLFSQSMIIIRPILEYATPICAPTKPTAKEKIDSFQYRASKIITCAASSTNIEAEKECGLTPIRKQKKIIYN
ncbi:hypothetical protein TNCV_3192381 [Trichonephila clavipes]|nr:hypothetical protein TNCV_3192381 [Trichonephila clavipes]